jgi:hypothetical protein
MARPGIDWVASLRLTNTTADPAAFTVHAFDAAGADLDTFSDSIPPRGQRTYGLEEMFPGNASSMAWFSVESPVPLVGDIFCASNDLAELVSYAGL